MSARTAGGTPASEGAAASPAAGGLIDGPRQQHLLLDLIDQQLDEVLADLDPARSAHRLV